MSQTGDERGSILIEVLVSGIMLVITAVGVFSAFEAGNRASAEERHRAQAEGLAQADIARLRTMRISALSNLHQTKVVTIEKTPYTIESAAQAVTDTTGTASCEEEAADPRYIRISSKITWPSLGSRAPVEEQSSVAPPNGSISAKSGSLVVQIEDAENEGVSDVSLSGVGAGTFYGVTGANGCAIFDDLLAGNYTLSLSGALLLDKNGEPPAPMETSVVQESTNTLVLQYDVGGRIVADFQTMIEGEPVPSKADAVIVYNGGMLAPKAYGTPGELHKEITAEPLFPFSSPYAVYAGTCQENNPGELAPEGAVGQGIVSSKGTTPVTITLPALYLTAWSGTEAEKGSPAQGAHVKVAETTCAAGGAQTRTYTTNSKGQLSDPGLPFGTYDVCVSTGGKHISVADVAVPESSEELESGAPLDVFFGAPGVLEGECP